MFQIMLMPNPEKFLSLVRQSCGNVLLHLPDGRECDLKRDHTAQQMLRTIELSRDGLSISFSDPDDTPAFIKYMMEASL